jgi:hypothetical protein
MVKYTSDNEQAFWSWSVKKSKSCDSSTGIVLGYELDDQGPRIRFPGWAWNFSLHHHFQNGTGAHPASYQVDTRGSFPGGKMARA